MRFAGGSAGAALVAAAATRGVPFSVVDIGDREIAELYETTLVLVRPDGHVAWRGAVDPEHTGNLLSVMLAIDLLEQAERPVLSDQQVNGAAIGRFVAGQVSEQR